MQRSKIDTEKTIEEQQIEKTGKVFKCKTCHHGYRVQLAPFQPVVLVCHEGPGQSQFTPNAQGMALQTVARVTADDFFCHRYQESVPYSHPN